MKFKPKPKNNRADFKAPTKKVVAARVAYRCSLPGCRRITIGPSMDHANRSITLGKAAHIYAAAPNGPRANLDMTEAELTHLDNAIWLCAHHAEIIDKDPERYAAETLKNWKINAERETYLLLYELRKERERTHSTLLALTSDLLFYGTWTSANDEGDRWEFEIEEFVYGDIDGMQHLQQKFDTIPVWEKFLAIESQGQGRALRSFRWKKNPDESYRIKCSLEPKVARIDPHMTGVDIALDFKFENNDLKMVEGIDGAIQSLQILLGSRPGDFAEGSTIGSHFSEYCRKYEDDPVLLNRRIKVEIIRLMEVKYGDESEGAELGFINRVLNVEVLELNIEQGFARLSLELELGNFEHWKKDLSILVRNPTDPSWWDWEL